jgi:hypothetical protein
MELSTIILGMSETKIDWENIGNMYGGEKQFLQSCVCMNDKQRIKRKST